jgi:hypothetical protein
MLAGMSPPFNHFEMADLRNRALQEIGLSSISRADGLRIYAAEIAYDALCGRAEALTTLRELNRISIEVDYPSELSDLYLLYYAWDDLLTYNEQWYWPGATRDNIAEIAHEALRRFVDEACAHGLLERPEAGP